MATAITKDSTMAELCAAMDEAAVSWGLDATRYADPLSVPALAWSLQRGDYAERWLWHAGSLYRYAGGVYRRDGDTWAAVRLREIVVTAAERMAEAAAERATLTGPAWREACAALDLLAITLPGAAVKGLRRQAEAAGLWPTPAKTRQDAEARYTTRGLVEPVLAALAADVRGATEGVVVDRDIDTLNLRNGLLDLRTMTLRPHDPDHYSTIQLPVAYDLDADCQRFGRYLSEVLPEDAIPVVEEMMGYLLTPDTSMHKAFLLLGGGSNGKSLLLDVLRAMLGPENCSATPLQALGEDKWAPASLVGKLANLCADLPAATQRDTSKFKEIVAGDTRNAE